MDIFLIAFVLCESMRLIEISVFRRFYHAMQKRLIFLHSRSTSTMYDYFWNLIFVNVESVENHEKSLQLKEIGGKIISVPFVIKR